MRPSAMQQMAWALRMVERRCATTNTVRLFLAMRSSNAAWTLRSDSASKADVASSSNRTLGLRARARAMAMRCFWPPDIVAPRSPTSVSSSSGSLRMKSRAWAMASKSFTCEGEGS
mmetsp:Transcript_23179/g.71249  ORF Transcript_23179/g.71249 Transcript_23179/m.71249 type:complete len:116 (+) Transcript_23179:79-426(+)